MGSVLFMVSIYFLVLTSSYCYTFMDLYNQDNVVQPASLHDGMQNKNLKS